jgi:serine protease
MAAPHVAGAAALLVSEGITSPGAVRDALAAGARPADDKALYGAGILDAGASLASAVRTRLLVRLAALVLLFGFVARRIRSRGGVVAKSPLALGAALVGAVGLVPFAPWVGLGGRGLWAELLARPVGEWDLALGAGIHRWLPLAGALPALAFAALFFGVSRLRPAIGGFAVGAAALATQLALSGDAAFAFGSLAMRVYMAASVVACAWIARIALDAKRT